MLPLGSYEEGRFAAPAPELRKIHTAQLDAALNLLLKQPSYLRLEQPLLSTTGLYGVGTVAVEDSVAGGTGEPAAPSLTKSPG
jgi:hypothetical protein